MLESPDRKPSARPSDLRFQILNDRDQPQLTYQLRHQRKLHLIVVRRDLTGFLHLHPIQDARGVWSVPVTIKRRGLYRVIADFQAKGPPVALGADLAVGANTQKVGPLPPPSSLARVAGYQVRLAQPKPGEALFSVTRDGRPVERLEPYLGDRGHVVALRQGDLAYAHVHPLSSQADSKRVTAHQALFRLELASGDPHRIFFQFRVKGQVHTAEFSSSSGFAPPDPDPAADDNPDAPEAEPQPEPQPEHSH